MHLRKCMLKHLMMKKRSQFDRKYFELEGALTTGSFFDITDTGPFNICKISFLFNNSMSIYMT